MAADGKSPSAPEPGPLYSQYASEDDRGSVASQSIQKIASRQLK
jgi:hypothetical protein